MRADVSSSVIESREKFKFQMYTNGGSSKWNLHSFDAGIEFTNKSDHIAILSYPLNVNEFL